jgi:hypothetical protein
MPDELKQVIEEQRKLQPPREEAKKERLATAGQQ